MIRRIIAAAAFACLVALLAHGAIAAAPPANGQEGVLRQHLISFLQSGSRLDQVSPSNPLHPLARFPITATTSYLVLGDDPELLKRFYPDISRLAMQWFREENLSPDGLLRARPAKGSTVALSPGLNALAAMDLYSLHLIAGAIGSHEESLDLLAWSKRLADLTTRTFYDPTRDAFLPLDAAGSPMTIHSPDALLPLAMDRLLGRGASRRVVDRFAARMKPRAGSAAGPFDAGGLWDDPAARLPIMDLLGEITGEDPAIQSLMRAAADRDLFTAGSAAWADFWNARPAAARDLLPRWRVISGLVHLTLLFERDDLAEEKELASLRRDVDTLALALSAPRLEVVPYTAAITTANRLLSRMSRFVELIPNEQERWRVIDGMKWARLSPRTRRLVTEACAEAVEEIRRSKAALSLAVEPEARLITEIDLPTKPVAVGRSIDFAMSLASSAGPRSISQFYVQIGQNRWKVIDAGKTLTIEPGSAAIVHRGALTLPPTTEPGIVTLPFFYDFLLDGRRIEIHRIESIVLSREYELTMNLPEGRRLRDRGTPIAMRLSYRPDRDIQGAVEGSFLREISTEPALPARFLVKRTSDVTPLTIVAGPRGAIPPGRYPFSISVTLDGKPIGFFEESLVRPFRWFQLGPLNPADGALQNGADLAAGLLKPFAASDGRELRWREVEPGAIDAEGAVLPSKLYANAGGGCFLLYTVAEAPKRMKLVWRLETKNVTAFWINSEIVVSASESHTDRMGGPIELRPGLNTFVIACCAENEADRVVFELSEESGLPPTGLRNDIDNLVDGFEALVVETPKPEAPAQAAEHLREVVLTLSYPEATEVSVIGSFNNWQPGATIMMREPDRSWRASLYLQPGRYAYKFLINRKTRITDPSCALTEPDGFGGTNSVLEVR